MSANLAIRNLRVRVEGQEILRGLDLEMNRGEVHAIMGPNGSGKSTLANTLMGHPSYEVTEGEVVFRGQNLVERTPDERSRLGLFLAFQYPSAIPGVSVANFLRTAVNARRGPSAGGNGNGKAKGIPMREFRKLLKDKMAMLKMDPSFARRYLNDGFSGGDQSRSVLSRSSRNMMICRLSLVRPRV